MRQNCEKFFGQVRGEACIVCAEKKAARRRDRPLGRLAVFLWALAWTLALVWGPTAARAQTGAATTVRVGYFDNGDFMHKEADGTYAGYDVEYYYTLAGYAGWNIRFVEFGSLREALAAMKNGRIDMMSGLSKTQEREQDYLISEQKMCASRIGVQTRADDDRFTPGDASTMQEMTCGILKGSNVVTLYTDWCAANGLVPHVVEYNSLDARNAALMRGEVDAIAGGSTIAGAQRVAEFPSLDLYFMLNRDKTALKAQLDRAMSLQNLQDPTYSTELYARYFPASRNTAPSFASPEKAFIAAHPTIRVAVLENDAPFSSVAANGAVTGILPDYFAHLSQVVGSTFSCLPYPDKTAACAALDAGEVDAVGKFEQDIFDANDRGLLLTVPYLRMNLVQITRAGTNSVARAAVPACNLVQVTGELADGGSAMAAQGFLNGEKSFAALKSGGVDAVICTQPAATWLLNRNRASDYVVTSFGAKTWNSCCATAGGADGNLLRAILNKTIAVDAGYTNQLVTSDTLEDSADLAGVFDRLPVSVLATAALVLVVLLALAVSVLVILLHRRDAEKRLAARQTALAAAEEANKARHTFFGAVSHDMRTPLNGILGFTDLALQSDDPAQVKGYLAKIQTSGTILNNLVNDTLVMSRLENGQYVLKPAPCDLAALLSEVVQPIRMMAGERGVRFVEDAGALPPRGVLVDRLSLQKIFLNLLSNAVKFTPAGGTVTLHCARDAADAAHPADVFTISDTGRGISRRFLPHVFEPFAQESPANADTSGSGMGLSIVKSIVDAMGGTIAAVSEPGCGTSFTVRLFLPDAPLPAAPAPAAAPDAGLLAGKRVLVCEDNALNLEILRAILERQGMQVTGAENGQKGLDAFAASRPGWFDAVLLDLRMPVMDGMTAARAIRALARPDAAAVPILAVSADAYPENVAACLAAGMDGHVAKPVNADVLARTLARLLAKKS